MTGRWPTPAAASFSISCATVPWKGSASPCTGVHCFERGGSGGAWEASDERPCSAPAAVARTGNGQHRQGCNRLRRVARPAGAHLPAADGRRVLDRQQPCLRYLPRHPGGGPAHRAVQALARLQGRLQFSLACSSLACSSSRNVSRPGRGRRRGFGMRAQAGVRHVGGGGAACGQRSLLPGGGDCCPAAADSCHPPRLTSTAQSVLLNATRRSDLLS